MTNYVTRRQLAGHFKVTDRAVDKWRADGLLPEPVKLGESMQARVRWPADVIPKLEAALRDRKAPSKSAGA